MKAQTLAVIALLLILAGATTAGGAAPQQITITMREFTYSPTKITLQASMPVAITLVNRGRKPHEFMVYDMPMGSSHMMVGHEWVEKTNYFKGMMVNVQGGRTRRRSGAFFEVEVAAGKTAVIAFTPAKKGTFEFACMIKGHYEAGQKGVLVVK